MIIWSWSTVKWEKQINVYKPYHQVLSNFDLKTVNTYSRETSLISTELAWQEISNDRRLDFLRYLVHGKIEILGEILILIDPYWSLLLHYKCMSFELLLNIGKYWSELRSNLGYLCWVFLLLNVLQSFAFFSFLKIFAILHVLWKKIREILLHSTLDSTFFNTR